LLIIPLTLTLAILRQRLWMVDPIVNRTIVYVALTASIAAIYTFCMVYLGAILQTGDSLIPSLLTTVIVAIVFAPLRDRLQRFVDRLMKGRHDDPYGLLLELRGLLVQPLPPEAMLEAIIRFIRLSLRIPYAAIEIEVNGVRRIVSSDSDGTTTGGHTYPIVHLGKEVGTLIAANRPSEPFTSLDHKLLNVLLSHAGPIVDNYMMTRGMKMLADDLQHSREKLILAREEERRRIRRNLHDELAPRLAALGLNATAAEMYVKRDPETATELLSELRQVIRSTVEDIRTLVHEMRPASLDDRGLEGAIQERIHELNKPLQAVGQLDTANHQAVGLHFEFHVPHPLPVLPAAIEVAAYWIATEAIGNAVRHSQATSCSVTLDAQSPGLLTLQVIDNGIGIDERWLSRATSGIGISSMQERAAELGGSCVVGRNLLGGTIVSARLPIMSAAMIS
jgi:signal transduction histidine kinase